MSRLHRCDVDRRQVYTLKSTTHLPILHLHTIQDPFDVLLDNRRWLCRSCRNTRMRKEIFFISRLSLHKFKTHLNNPFKNTGLKSFSLVCRSSSSLKFPSPTVRRTPSA